jgi:hypothetical protein
MWYTGHFCVSRSSATAELLRGAIAHSERSRPNGLASAIDACCLASSLLVGRPWQFAQPE